MADRMVASMIERHRRYGWSTPVGEWGAIQREDRADFHGALDAGDADEIEAQLDDMLNGPLSFGLVTQSPNAQHLAPFLMWRLALWTKASQSRHMERLRAPAVGRPVIAEISGIPMMSDTPRFDYYAERISRVHPTTVMEIGCGYGGVALQLTRQAPDVRLVLVDIPETLYLAGWWLSHCGVDVTWWDEGVLSSSVRLVPAQDVTRNSWTGRVDLVCSFHTFSGLDRETIGTYLRWLTTSSARYFYHDDALTTETGVWLTAVYPEQLCADMAPRGFREVWRERQPWTGPDDRFCEVFYERVAS
jgi:hypothetical protein